MFNFAAPKISIRAATWDVPEGVKWIEEVFKKYEVITPFGGVKKLSKPFEGCEIINTGRGNIIHIKREAR